MKLTADTITDEQICELRDEVTGLAHPGSVTCPKCGVRRDETCLLKVPRAHLHLVTRKDPHRERFEASRNENERRIAVRELCEIALGRLNSAARTMARARCAEILNARAEGKS